VRILLTGGAGYIGSHVAKELASAGHVPVVLDNLSRGHRDAVRWGPLLQVDLADQRRLAVEIERNRIDAVIHMAALAYVHESIVDPASYFRDNVAGTQNLLDAMRLTGRKQIIFSSTCATYGDPQVLPIPESHPQVPKNPYGESKRMAEQLLRWYGHAYGLSWIALRYFNAAGCDRDGEIGELHDPETHLIPRAIAAAEGDIAALEVFGSDYDTHDGTAVRDYVHVTDLARAHVRSLELLRTGAASRALNLGTGRGYSVGEVVRAVESVSGRTVEVIHRPRRAGDPPVLVGDASQATRELDWVPRYSSLNTMVETAHRWYIKSRQARRMERQQPTNAAMA